MNGFRTLSAFLADLEKRGDLERVRREVDWAFEVTEIACREAKREGPALLFENVRGARFPLAVNVLAARRRIEWAIGRSPRAVGAEIETLFHALPPQALGDLWALRGSARRVLASRPERLERGPAQTHTLGADLASLPILQLWPKDGGRFVTFPLVFTEDPDTRKRNLGIYRMHVYDGKTTGMHWQIGKGGGFHFHKAEKRGAGLEVAVAVGADPATLLAAVAPLPEGIDELAFAGFLRGAPTRLSKARTLSMMVPADAEFVIEGVVPAGERRLEGPFGDHFGHYSHAAHFPVFHVKDVTHRERPVFQASVVGKPPQEDLWMGEAVQEMFTGVLKVIHPEIVDLWAYFEAGFHNLLVVSVENRFAREARKTALGLLGTGQLSLTKCVVLVDPDRRPARPAGRVRRAGAQLRRVGRPADDPRRAARHARLHLVHHEPRQQDGARRAEQGRAFAARAAAGGRRPARLRRARARLAPGVGRRAGGARARGGRWRRCRVAGGRGSARCDHARARGDRETRTPRRVRRRAAARRRERRHRPGRRRHAAVGLVHALRLRARRGAGERRGARARGCRRAGRWGSTRRGSRGIRSRWRVCGDDREGGGWRG